MAQRSRPLSRRRFCQGASAAPIVAGLPVLARQWPTYEKMLAVALTDIILPFSPGRLELVTFEHVFQEGVHHMKAVIRLTWPPGTRQRPLAAAAPKESPTLEKLLEQVHERFPIQFDGSKWANSVSFRVRQT